MRAAKRFIRRTGLRDPLVMIPEEGTWGDGVGRSGFNAPKGTLAQRTERATRWLWSRGIYPGVAALALRVHGHARANLNGTECRARRAVMTELGIPLQRQPGAAGLARLERLGWATLTTSYERYLATCKSSLDLPADFGRVFEAAAKPGDLRDLVAADIRLGKPAGRVAPRHTDPPAA